MNTTVAEYTDQEVFRYLLSIAAEDAEIRRQLQEILETDPVQRQQMLKLLLRHTKLQNAPRGLRHVFEYFQDAMFAAEVLGYLRRL